MMFHDYASPITEPIEKHWVIRHHLQKKDPSAAVSDPVEPIVYYVDNGTPEPIRSGPARRRTLVGRGLRGRRLPQRLPGAGPAGRRRPDGPALQHDPLGTPIDARLVLRGRSGRSAHGADPEGQREPRIAAGAAGHHDRQRLDVGGQHRRPATSARQAILRTRTTSPTATRRPTPRRCRWRGSGSSRPTRSDTRWASRTTSPPARTAAPR